MRHGVTGTKLKPVSAACPINAADSVLPASLFTGVITDTAPVRGGAEDGEVLGTVVAVAKGRDRDVEAGLGVPRLPPPHPAKESTIRDKQINERVPESKKECWRRIDSPSATKGQQLWGCGALDYNQLPKNVYSLISKILFTLTFNPQPLFPAPLKSADI